MGEHLMPSLALPEPGEIHVWMGHPKGSEMELSGDELDRAVRYRTSLARRRFVGRRATLRKLVGRYLGLDPLALRFGRESGGRPYLQVGAGFPDLRFNLAEADGLVVLGFRVGAGVGVDVEVDRPGVDLERLAIRLLTPEERRRLESLPSRQRSKALLRAWVRKEAYLKGTGRGIGGRLSEVEVGLAGRWGTVRDRGTNSASSWYVTDLVFPGCEAPVGVAAEGRPFGMVIRSLHPWSRGEAVEEQKGMVPSLVSLT